MAKSRLKIAVRVSLLLLAVFAAGTAPASPRFETATPIKHLVVIFQENHSFDAYFAHLSRGRQPARAAAFPRAPGTPSVNGLTDPARAEPELVESVPDRPPAVVSPATRTTSTPPSSARGTVA